MVATFPLDTHGILVDALDRVRTTLNLSKLPHGELDQLQDTEGLAEDKPDDARRDTDSRSYDEYAKREQEHDPEDVEPHREPPLGGERQEVFRVHLVHVVQETADELPRAQRV